MNEKNVKIRLLLVVGFTDHIHIYISKKEQKKRADQLRKKSMVLVTTNN
jgi:hypothetical protein